MVIKYNISDKVLMLLLGAKSIIGRHNNWINLCIMVIILHLLLCIINIEIKIARHFNLTAVL